MKLTHPIAIVGIGGIFPGAATLEEFWKNIEHGISASQDVPQGRWPLDLEDIFDPARGMTDTVYSKRGCYIADFDLDPEGLHLDPALLKELDPVFHFALYAAREAFRDAKLTHVDRRRSGVIIGNIVLPTEKTSAITAEILGRTFEEKVLSRPPYPPQGGKGPTPSPSQEGNTPPCPPQGGIMTHPINCHAVGLVAGLIAKALDLGGGSYTIDGACAASLYALNYAMMELQAGRADLMLTGGVCRPDSAFTQMGFSQLRALSPTGVCAPFDEKGDGLVVGEGAGMFVLKRLDDAIRDENRIYAVIRGIGLSNDRRGALLAPDSEGQLRAMQAAYRHAGWSPQDVDLIECHATGTPVGDVIEFQSLRALWGDDGWQPQQCVIGGVKSNVGHLLTGAGAASLMKVILALKHQALPPTANFSRPAPNIELRQSPFNILTQAKPWEKRNNKSPRRSAVSAFGFGGINAHVLLEEWSDEAPRYSNTPFLHHSGAPEPIAIIGMATHFGPWTSLQTFQERVLGGGTPVDPTIKKDWWGVEKSDWYKRAGLTDFPCQGYFIDEISIPIGRFRIPPKELQESLPQQLLMLQVAAAALEDAELDLHDEAALRTGVFIGIGLDFNSTNFSYRWRILKKAKAWAEALGLNFNDNEFQTWVHSLRDTFGPPLTANRTVGALGGIVASRIAREFHVGGPGITVSSEENSGLSALNTAVRSLQHDDIDQAIVGAVDLHGDVRSILMRHSQHLDNGDLPGEGAAAVVVKRLSDAVRDGNTIYALIKGIGTASGQESDLKTPESTTYHNALDRAYQDAHLSPMTIQYLETQGNASPQDDQIEISALSQYFSKRTETAAASQTSLWQKKPTCALGSVKADIGHSGAAAGLASLVKTCLCLYQEIIPALRNSGRLHEAFPDQSSPLYFPSGPQYWLRNKAEGPRRAGVTSFGADGNCMHVVLEAYEPSDKNKRISSQTSYHQPLGPKDDVLLTVEADDQATLLEKLQYLHTHITQHESTSLEFAAREWWDRHKTDNHRKLGVALVINDRTELSNHLETVRQAILLDASKTFPGNRIFYNQNPIGLTGEVAFVFPGSGNHYPGMGRDLSAQWPEILRQQDTQNRYLKNQFIPELLWNTASSDMIDHYPREILLGQVAYSTMMTDLLHHFGVRPHAVIGYSLGESSALFALKAWTERDEMVQRLLASPLYSRDLAGEFLAVRKTWSLADDTAVDWILAAVQCSAEKVREVLKDRRRAYLLIINTPNSCVIGGNRQVVTDVVEQLNCNYHLLSGVSAAHCEIIEQVAQAYRDLHYFKTTKAPAGVRFYSGAWGKSYVVTPDSAADAILAQASETINFPVVIHQAYRDGVRVFLEIGPGNSCSTMIDKILETHPHLAVSSCATNYENVSSMLRLLGRLIAERVPVNLSPLYGEQPSVIVQHRTIEHPAKLLKIPTGRTPFQIEIPIPTQSPENPTTKTEHVRSAGHDSETPPLSGGDTIQHSQSDMTAIVQEISSAQTSKARAHEAYLKLAQGLTESYSKQIAFQMSLLESMQHLGARAGCPRSQDVFMTREQCMEFAVGSIANILGEKFAEVDTYPTRVRLPDAPLMLVDRILQIEGEAGSLTHGRVITEHEIYPNDWYLDCGRIPTCIAVESGQADLFLSAYLGIDLVIQGMAVYRLLDAAVTFHRDLPGPGSVIRYDIHIDEFFRQGQTYLFRFRFKSTINGELLLTMENGCAGFFTRAELDEGRGLVFSEMDLRAMPGKKPDDWQPLTEMPVAGAIESYSEDQLDALRNGELAACFGSQFAGLPLQYPCRLPGGRMKLVDRILSLDPQGGRYRLGQIRGEADIHPDDWFLTCHFVDDQVMPGTLMYECCLHTLRIFLMRMGWVAEQHEIAWQPVPGIAGQLKCRGQVIATTKKVIYEISLKEIGYRPEPYVICDAIMYADNKAIVRMIDMSLRLSGMTREKLENIWRRKPALFDSEKILAFSNGNPSEAFGERYRVFDHERIIARLPGPPYQFLDRITAVEGEQWVMEAEKMAEAQYDVPSDAWYFVANHNRNMPFSVLLEIVLQPCGWLAAYAGSALTSQSDLSFRNLGGKATQFLPVAQDIGTLTTVVKMTSVSTSGGMIIQHYTYELTNQPGDVIYQGTTYFGFFTKQALAHQIGIRDARPYQPTPEEIGRGETFSYPKEAPFPTSQLRMVDTIEIFVADGGPHGLGFIRGTKIVNPEEWFFKAHFYQDPVWPGSLGLESFLQLLKVVAIKRWGWHPNDQFETMVLNHPHHWTYRGQVIPRDHQVTIQAVITRVDDSQHLLEAAGFLLVDGRVIYHMENFTLRVING